jgi:hypothetical protein
MLMLNHLARPLLILCLLTALAVARIASAQDTEPQEQLAAESTAEEQPTEPQQDAAQPNVEYEHLKVLDTLVGTWQGKGTDPESGVEFEFKFTVSWSPNKKLLMGDGMVRAALPGQGNLEEQEFGPGWRTFWVWNQQEQRLEDHSFNISGPEEGIQNLSVWTMEKDGVFSIRVESSSAAGPLRRPESITLVVSGDAATIVTVGATNKQGERLPTEAIAMKRVE